MSLQEAQTAWSEASEKTDSKLDEIAEKENAIAERQEELEKKMKKMRERDPFIYD